MSWPANPVPCNGTRRLLCASPYPSRPLSWISKSVRASRRLTMTGVQAPVVPGSAGGSACAALHPQPLDGAANLSRNSKRSTGWSNPAGVLRVSAPGEPSSYR